MNMQLVACLKDKQHNHDAKFFIEPVGMKFEAAFTSKPAAALVPWMQTIQDFFPSLNV